MFHRGLNMFNVSFNYVILLISDKSPPLEMSSVLISVVGYLISDEQIMHLENCSVDFPFQRVDFQ